jgi:cyd operon protein YbgT
VIPTTIRSEQFEIDQETNPMWYFAWILGVLLAVAFGIINVMWYESEQCLGEAEDGKLDA